MVPTSSYIQFWPLTGPQHEIGRIESLADLWRAQGSTRCSGCSAFWPSGYPESGRGLRLGGKDEEESRGRLFGLAPIQAENPRQRTVECYLHRGEQLIKTFKRITRSAWIHASGRTCVALLGRPNTLLPQPKRRDTRLEVTRRA